MKITSWNIDRFGIWENLSVSNLSEQINVFYGPNEAGKTTLMQFIRGMLYGFAGERARYVSGLQLRWNANENAPLPQDIKTTAGGSLTVRTTAGPFTLKREFVTENRKSRENFTIIGQDGLFPGEQFSKHFSAVIDETTFSNVFAIGLDELQQLGILTDSEASEVLYRLTMGIDRVSLLDTTKKLVKDRNAWLDPSGKPSQMLELLEKKVQLKKEILSARDKLRNYVEILTEHQQIDRIVAQIETELQKLRHESRLYKTASFIMEKWDLRTEIQREIRLMGAVRKAEPEVLDVLEDLKQKIAARRQTLTDLKKLFWDQKKRFNAMKISETLLEYTPRLEVVLEQKDFIVELDAEIAKIRQEREDLKKRLLDHEKGIIPEGTINSALPRLDDYHIPAKELHLARQKYKKVKNEHGQYEEKLKILDSKVSADQFNRKVENIAEAVEKAGEQVNHLRRRQTIQQRFDEMVQYRKELDRVNAHLVQHQTLSPVVLAMLIALFAGGAVITALAMLGHIPSAFAVVGICFAAGAPGGKMALDRRNAKKLEANQRQISMLNGQMDHAKQEAAAIDARYPSQGKSIEMRFQAAQLELATLEKLIPLDAQRQEVLHYFKQYEVRLKKSRHNLKLATKRWHSWLDTVGLPRETSLDQIRNLMEQADTVGGVREEYRKKKEELSLRRREMEMLVGQLTRIAMAAEIVIPENATPVELMEKIHKEIHENSDRFQQKKQIRKELRKNRRLRKKEDAALSELVTQRIELLDSYGVERTEAVRELVAQYQEYLNLVDERDALQREITAALGEFCTEKEMQQILEPDKRENLPALQQQMDDRIELLSAELHEELEKKGDLNRQLVGLESDQEISGKQLELAMLNEQLRSGMARWRKQALAGHVLDAIRQEYEKQRQPETLNESSAYFAKMTNGRYDRVWSPIGEETLHVDDFAGNAVDVSWLSRGTREQLFVAIRLALATSFERDGTSLPLVFDDILVNYDTKRAWSTAKTLLEFAAAGRQIFLFTCHEHICRIFHKLNVPIHILPTFSDSPKQIRILYPVSTEPKPVKQEPEVEIPFEEEPVFEEPVIEEPIVEEPVIEEVIEEEMIPEPLPALPRKKKRKNRKKTTPVVESVVETMVKTVIAPKPVAPEEFFQEPETDLVEEITQNGFYTQRGVFDVDFFDDREAKTFEESFPEPSFPSIVSDNQLDDLPDDPSDDQLDEPPMLEEEMTEELEANDFFVKGFFDEEIDEQELGEHFPQN